MKDFYIDWIDDHTFETDDGKWFMGDPNTGEPINDRIFDNEDDFQDYIWNYAIGHAHEDLIA